MHLTLVLATILVLTSGDRFDVAGEVRYEGNNAVFRATDGALYSVPRSEVDERATREASAPKKVSDGTKKLKLTPEERQRLLDELSKNRNGKPPAKQAVLEQPVPAPTKQEQASTTADEWQWRRQARAHDEDVLQARENLQLLNDRIEHLRSEISSFLSLGYKPKDFTLQTTQLQRAIDQIPGAELEVRRAERARSQFLDDARRQGVLPGWLR
jgi:hypothetical protein